MNYYTFQVEPITCEHCGWQGTGADAARGESFAALFEVHCPQCDAKLGFCEYPTRQDAEAAWDLVPEADRIQFALQSRLADVYDRHALRRADQLPAIDEPSFRLAWDVEEVEGTYPKNWTVIRLGDRAIWREPAMYEDAGRFVEIAAMLKERYGAALTDLEPTPASFDCLYGDCLAAPGIVDQARRALATSGGSPASDGA